jgi:aerobic carbon-monoxide dehydrogenase small subunit
MPQKWPMQVTVNGVQYKAEVEPRLLLADFLRHHLRLTGTHIGCEHGVCGACTVLVNGQSVRSCLLFTPQVNGAEVTTVEGLAPQGQLSPLQEAFREHHALQCGFCTPGMLMTAYELLQHNSRPTETEIRQVLSGNLCRCTGYQNIVQAIRAASTSAVESV